MFLTPDGQALFLLRGDGGDYPRHWAWPGGRTEDGETPEETAVRETIEEAGSCPDGERRLLDRWTFTTEEGAQVEFSTFLQRVPAPFIPTLCDEHTGWTWAKTTSPPAPLHPGAARVLAFIGMNELEMARAMRDGLVISPQRVGNLALFAMRVTGTGLAYRASINEYAWRDASLYMTEDFCERCQGLPVILDHPDGPLNGEEYAQRVVGAVFLPYLDHERQEVWAIVRIHDEVTAQAIERGEFSTSPRVDFRTVEETGVRKEIGDGNTVLIEGAPFILDHLAITTTSPGVWDKGRGLEGIKVGEPAREPDPVPAVAAPIFDAAIAARIDAMHIDARLGLLATRARGRAA
jgi:8-oxo-dGTP pyrophosphatase MutT (NUDIX family)